ncbi:MAG: tetratricopeptide repeat protein [Chthoniobacterales bacterium]|nr:tetratricopeptide repeat protein [Chthoniobacterales bacterium]
MKTDKDLSPAKKSAYLKAMSALEMRNHGLVIALMGPMVADEPEFFAGRRLLREAEVLRARAGKSSFLGISGSGLSLGKSKAQRALETGDWAGAINAAEKALETDPMGAQPNKDLFNAAESVAKEAREKIKNELQPALESAPAESKPEVEMDLFDASERMRTYEVIARFALETIALEPKNTKARHEIAKYLMEIEEYDEAAKMFDEIIRLNPMDLDARDKSKEAAARRSMQRGKLGTSSFADLIKQRQEGGPGEKVVNAAESAEDLARQVYEAHEAGNPDRESARKLADLYHSQEDYDNALQYYRYLSDLAEGTDPGLLRKISDVEMRGLSKSIVDMEKQLVLLAADDPAAAALRAQVDELRRGKAEQMLGEARKRVDRNPADLQYRFELGEQLVLAGYFKDAIPELQKARTNPNTRTRALNLLGKCYTERNMLDLAAKTLTDAASEIPGMDGTKKDILYQLGLVYERMGDKEKSLDCMKQIYEVDYGYLDVAARVEASYTA